MSLGFKTPFIYISCVQVRPVKVEQYLELAVKINSDFETFEPGKLYHNFD